MYSEDYPPAHFQAEYGEHKALVDIHAFVVIRGRLPPRVLGLVVEWASQHQAELHVLWERAVQRQSLYKLPPLT